MPFIKEPDPESLAFSDEIRRSVWLIDECGVVKDTHRVYDWYYRDPRCETCIPACVRNDDWWLDEIEYVLPEPFAHWLTNAWPTFEHDVVGLATYCWLKRLSWSDVADFLTKFWREHESDLRYLIRPKQLNV